MDAEGQGKVANKENRVKVLDGYNGNTHVWMEHGNNWILYQQGRLMRCRKDV